MGQDPTTYYRYTGPARMHKAIHTLSGILTGILADQTIYQKELRIIDGWVSSHWDFRTRHPFNEVIPKLMEALERHRISEDAYEEMLFLCRNLSAEQGYYDLVTQDMQELHGVMAGVSFDGEILAAELDGMRDWMEPRAYLKSLWPYDEIESLITSVLRDRRIDELEHRELMAFFSDFAATTGHASIALTIDDTFLVRGVCAVEPKIQFDDKLFCFTGVSECALRADLVALIKSRGARFNDRIVLDTDYLIVGAQGNPCWAYACYGRKIEQAIKHRKNGHRILIIHELDFWDCLKP